MSQRLKKILLVGALAILILVSSTHLAFAEEKGLAQKVAEKVGGVITDIQYTIVSKAAFAISFLVASIGGIVVAIEAWLVGIILQINTGLVNSNVVQFGYPVTLSLANLGFVLAIIIIAIATIVRWEKYGIKQLLFKVVAMAILVNFGLVLAGTILNFSDSLSTYFLSNIDPSGNVGGATNGASSFVNFAGHLAGALNPQNTFGLNSVESQDSATMMAKIGKSYGSYIVPLVSIVFTIATLTIIIITLATLIVMLEIRYVWLGILLVLLPLAWMLWIFPGFSKKFTQWWDKFIQQAFFPPVVLFFLWLAMKVSESMSQANGQFNIQTYTSDSNFIWKAISELLTNIGTPVIQAFLQAMMVGGLMLGGLFAAKGMGVSFADAGIKGATAVKNSALGFAGRGARRIGARIVPPKTLQERGESLMKTQRGGILGYAQRLTGRGLTTLGRAGGANLVGKYEEMHKGKSTEQLQEALRASPLGVSDQERVAIAKLMQGKDALDKLTPAEVAALGNKSMYENAQAMDVFKKVTEDPNIAIQLAYNKLKKTPPPTVLSEEQEKQLKDSEVKTRAQQAKEFAEANGNYEKALSKRPVDKAIGDITADSEKIKDMEAKGKLPLGFQSGDEFRQYQEQLAKVMAETWNPNKFASLLRDDKMGKEQLETLKGIYQRLNNPSQGKIFGLNNVNESLKNYFSSNAARNLGVNPEDVFGFPFAGEAQENKNQGNQPKQPAGFSMPKTPPSGANPPPPNNPPPGATPPPPSNPPPKTP